MDVATIAAVQRHTSYLLPDTSSSAAWIWNPWCHSHRPYIISHALAMYLINNYCERYISWPTFFKGDPKATFHSYYNCRGGRYSFPWIVLFTLDPYLIILSLTQEGTKYHVLSSVWLDRTLNPALLDFWRTL